MMPSMKTETLLNASSGGSPAAMGLAVSAVWVLAALQCAVFVAGGGTAYRIIGALVFVATSAFALRPGANTWRLAGLVVLGAIGLANFAAHLFVAMPPFPLRLLQAAIVFGYGSLCLSGAGALLFRRQAAGLLVFAITMTAGMVTVEATISRFRPALPPVSNVMRWVGGTLPHPVLEEYYPPHSQMQTIYKSNPRGYFKTSDPRSSRTRSDLPVEYSIPYRFNDHGCRGPDYVVPAPPNRRRILALGDSYTVGIGVYEEDTLTVQLQALLNADASAHGGTTYDVINCGVSGFGTRQERRMFEILGPVYQPDIVIVAMVFNDDMSFRSEVEHGYVHVPDKFEQLLFTWGMVQFMRHEQRRPPANFVGSLEEARMLRDLCARQHARLVVVAFRHQPLWFAWESLIKTMSAGLAGDSGVAWLDLGDRLLADHAGELLVVHPGGDRHPNEIAHRSAAEQLAELLRAHDMLH